MVKAYLILQDGSIYEGESIGSEGQTIGRIIPYNGITGYQQILTDPSYVGELVCMTFPIIGSVGISNYDENNINIQAAGVIVREANAEPFCVSSDQNLHDWLKGHHCVGIQGVDTRSIMRRVMAHGKMAAVITCDQTPDIDALIHLAASFHQEDTTRKVTTRSVQLYGKAEGETPLIAVLDLGISQKEKDALIRRGARLKIFPFNASGEHIRSFHPDAIYVSSGPEPHPDDRAVVAKSLLQMIGTKPVFAAGNGHLVLAQAYGLTIQALRNGHHGVNYPVRDQTTKTTYVTSQNHTLVVNPASIDPSKKISVTHQNINDDSIEGLCYAHHVYSVQFVPDTVTQGFNTGYLWDRFIGNIR